MIDRGDIMKRCKKCYMPDTRPNTGFARGVCQACRNFGKLENVDWEQRVGDLRALVENTLAGFKGSHDCVVPVSGGKNSYAMAWFVREKLGLNPLLVTVCDPFTKTGAGRHNLESIGEVFNCDHILYRMSPGVFKRATRLMFETTGEPLYFIEKAIYIYPFKVASQLGIPLVFFGESEFELGSHDETPYAKNCIRDKEQYRWRETIAQHH